MKYHFRCPKCFEWRTREWADRDAIKPCFDKDCGHRCAAPSPGDAADAWVDEYKAPPEMEDAVRKLRGPLCTVPICFANGDHLDHREPYDPGKTCVGNLFPMCESHNTSKGRQNYIDWLKTLKTKP